MKKIALLSIITATTLLFQGCGNDEKKPTNEKIYSLSTGSTAGAYYKEGQTIGKSMSEKGVSFKIVSSEGGEQNGRRVSKGIVDFGFIQKDTHNLLSTMDGLYSDNVNVLSKVGDEAILFVVNKKSDIKSENDIKNNKVKIAMTSKSSGAVSTLSTMGKLNKSFSGKEIVYKDFDQSINELRAGTIDALMIVQSTKIPNDKLTVALKDSNLTVIDITDTEVQNNKINGKKVYNDCSVKLDSQKVNTICTEALLISNKKVDTNVSTLIQSIKLD